MGIDNRGPAGDRSSTYPIEESFMINVSGQIKKDKSKEAKVEQVWTMLSLSVPFTHRIIVFIDNF